MAKLPGVSHRHAVRAFKKAGFWVVREGKHISMTDGDRIIEYVILPPEVVQEAYGRFVDRLPEEQKAIWIEHYFSKGNIKETFGDVLATIRCEFG